MMCLKGFLFYEACSLLNTDPVIIFSLFLFYFQNGQFEYIFPFECTSHVFFQLVSWSDILHLDQCFNSSQQSVHQISFCILPIIHIAICCYLLP